MQTVNFQCGHCGKLMGVGSEYLGQQVRCPHCQQVVIAPPPAEQTPTADPPPAAPEQPPPPPESSEIIVPPPPVAEDATDIFSPPEASDDLFSRIEPPRIEMPPDPFAPTLPAEGAAPPPEPAPEPALTATFPFLSPPTTSPPANGENTATLPPSGGESPWSASTVTETFTPPPSEPPVEMPIIPSPEPLMETAAPSTPRAPRRRESRTPWFFILVFSPLLLYAIVITIFAALIYRHEQQLEQQIRNPFEMMPDVGDNPGVQKGKKTTWLDNYDMKRATQPLPDHLCTTLEPDDKSEPIVIGDLQITPLSVKRERAQVLVDGFNKPEPQSADSLVLYLSMKNLSSEYAFAPLDNYFDRFWRRGNDQHPPLTQLEVGGRYRFFGGPAHWYPRGSSTPREWVVGRKGFEADLLQPGEERKFFVCTDGDDAKGVLNLFGESNGEKAGPAYHGQLLWRIRVRRGLAWIKDKQRPTTAVVGVKFTDKDIQ